MRRAAALLATALAASLILPATSAASDRVPVPIDDSLVVPFVAETGQSEFRQYRLAPEPKAFVVSPSGIAAWHQEATMELSLRRAYESCMRVARLPCRSFAENGMLIWNGPLDIEGQQEFARRQIAATRLNASRFGQEALDRNVAPVSDPAQGALHGATPLLLPGGTVVTTGALHEALQRPRPPLVIEVSSSSGERISTIPGAIWIDKAGTGIWRAADDVPEARSFRAAMARAAPDRAAPIVFTCYAATCWQSYRAALRALALGHADVSWYRGGVQSWRSAGLALAQTALFASVYDPDQEVAIVRRQESELRGLAPPDRRQPPLAARRWRAYLVAAHDREPVFHRAIDRIARLLSRGGVQRSDIAWLSSATREESRLPTRQNLEALFAPRTPARDEACFVYLTSHGDQNGIEVIAGRDSYALAPAELGRLLDRSCGAAPTVLVVSACYSGVYVDPTVLAPNRIVLTAARRDRASFGCSTDFEFSFYDGCFIDHLQGARSWPELAGKVIGCVRGRETETRMEPRSLPTATIGTEARNLQMVGARPPSPSPRRPAPQGPSDSTR